MMNVSAFLQVCGQEMSRFYRFNRPKPRLFSVFAGTFFIFSFLLSSRTSSFGQDCSGEVLNISANSPSRTGQISSWTVPAGGLRKVQITTKGAKGGDGVHGGGSGATMIGSFIVSPNQILEANAGAPGARGTISGYSGGGGGGSGVKIGNHVLIIAGAGGGGGYWNAGKGGLTSANGSGNGGAAWGGAGGGGLFSAGENLITFAGNSYGGGAGYNAFGGEVYTAAYGGGGFGGGGATNATAGGGGGGYTGGNGGSAFDGGRGGGSINYGANQSNTSEANNMGGQVIIVCLGEAKFGVSFSATSPGCGSTEGSLAIDLTDDNEGNTSGLEYAIVTGSSVSGIPTFASVDADPFVITSGLGTSAGIYTVRVRLKYNPDIYTDYTYSLTNAPDIIPPVINAGLMLADPVTVNTPVSLVINFMGSNITNATINWGDGSDAEVITNLSADPSHTYSRAGVYSPVVTITNSCGQSASASPAQYVVVYDPSAGFVTGGGWITSPAGAYRLQPSAAGKAHFGFESKYQKGKTTPSGNTEFKFQAGNMEFRSTFYQWLVISGSKAQFKGEGTINGSGQYGFLLTAMDGNMNKTATPDLFRIKIWDKQNSDALVYDNEYPEGDENSVSTQIGGGSIVIHVPKGKTAARTGEASLAEVQPLATLQLRALPNPSTSQFTLQWQSNRAETITLRVVDQLGRLLESRTAMPSSGSLTLGAQYQPGVYLVQVVQGVEQTTLRLIKQ